MSNPVDIDITQLDDGSYVLDSGEVVLPEELGLYEDEGVDWYAEEVDHRDAIYDQLIQVTPSEFVEFAIKMPNDGVPEDFSFSGREYLRVPYDIQAERVLLMCGRQVEKTVSLNTYISKKNGELVEAKRVSAGDCLASYNVEDHLSSSGVVTWVSGIYTKKGYRIKTRQGHEVEVGHEHPMRLFNRWVPAEKCKVGDRISVVRRAGIFEGPVVMCDEEIELIAMFLGDGCFSQGTLTGLPGPMMNRAEECLSSMGWSYRIQEKKNNRAIQISVHSRGKKGIQELSEGQEESRSGTKKIPSWVFHANKRQTALFLNRLWATDGHVKRNSKSKWSVEYCSTSNFMVRQVQALLWKFGIPSKIRENWPNYWKKQGIKKYAYILRIETLDGVRRFLQEIGALGKDESLNPPEEDLENNNRDTFPLEINNLIRQINRSRRGTNDYGNSLRAWGLRETLRYPPTRSKLQRYVKFFRQGPFNQKLVDELERHAAVTDVFWDEVESIEEIPALECVDFTVSPHHTFIADGFITHNSTLIGNSIMARMAIVPHFRALYVSPSHLQTKEFRRDRIGTPISLSDILQAYISPKSANNMSIIQFVNFSQLVLRYAYLTADRVRGIPTDAVYIDEIQDILTDNIPVIEECASHGRRDMRMYVYSGTPKSHDNTIEHLWQKRSTQNEFAIPCTCRTIVDMSAGDAGTHSSPYFWNVPLDELNIGLNGLSCARCNSLISAFHDDCTWVSMNPSIRDHPRLEPFESFRIPQLMVPWVEWKSILNKQESYSRSRFFNEVLAKSYDSGTRPLRMEDLMRNSVEDLSFRDHMELRMKTSGRPVFMGIDWGCHDDQTRILTEDGFKFFKELEPSDKVAQFDPDTREMTFVTPKVITTRDWDEPLLSFQTRNMDMMLTHTHRMLLTTASRDGWIVESAGETARRGGGVQFRGYVTWAGKEEETFTLPGIPKSAGYSGSQDRVFDMDDWVEFLGYLLTEGGVCVRDGKPYMIKMSQRGAVNPDKTAKMRDCMDRLEISYTEHLNDKTGDVNWSICGKQYWHWVSTKCGVLAKNKRLPREFLSLSPRQLRILFEAMVDGDGYRDPRYPGSGAFYSTSKGLCEDFQEVCIRLGIRAAVSLHKEAEGNRNTRWRVCWSPGRDLHLNVPKDKVESSPYSGKVYCCSVPTGFIVTERNGKIAYQGNTGEQSYTVITLGAYLPNPEGGDRFTVFYFKRCTGQLVEPYRQLEFIDRLIAQFDPLMVGTDYGGGFDRNNALITKYGPMKISRYQYIGGHQATKRPKIVFDSKKGRYLIDRTEVMADIFNAIRSDKIGFPRWAEWQEPYAADMLSIFSEYNEATRMIQFDKSPSSTDDSFHSAVYCFLASMIRFPRHDILHPRKGS